MDYTGAICPWGGDPSKDTPVSLEIVTAALKAAAKVVEQDAKEGR